MWHYVLGIIIDTEAFELQLPADKLHRLQALLSSWCARKSCTKKELESLLGHLSHAATVVCPGRTFLHQLFSLLHLTKAPHHFVCLGAGARADLVWWKCFLQSWSGSSFFPLPNPSHNVYSDASGTYGCGAVVDIFGYFQLQCLRGRRVYIEILMRQGRNATSHSVHNLIAAHCLSLKLPSCDSLHI